MGSARSTGRSAVPDATASGAALAALLREIAEVEVDQGTLTRALTHRSYAYEQGGLPHNERLEFLGDSVLGLVVTASIYARYPEAPEGRLARLRASVVSSRALAEVARTIGLGEHVLLGRGEQSTGGRDKASILADTMEAVIGAVYQDAGLDAATRLVTGLIDPMIRQYETLDNGLDWKTSLQELVNTLGEAQGGGQRQPEYVATHTGPDHAKEFTARLLLDGEELGAGRGPSKKVAEQTAARLAVAVLAARVEREDAGGPLPDDDSDRGTQGA